MKYILIFIVFIITSVSYIYWNRELKLNNSRLNTDFFILLQQANRTQLDLRSLNTIEWDELVLWPNSTNICDLNINNYKPGNFNCIQLDNPNEDYLVLLKNNNFAGRIKINKREGDFSKIAHQRISKSQARFVFINKGVFPQVDLDQSSF